MTELQSNEHGYLFPVYEDGSLLAWSISAYMTYDEESRGYPKARTVIRAMIEHRPEQLEQTRKQDIRDSLGRMFGHNARKKLKLIEELISIR